MRILRALIVVAALAHASLGATEEIAVRTADVLCVVVDSSSGALGSLSDGPETSGANHGRESEIAIPISTHAKK